MLSHLNALTFVNWSVETFNVTAEDRLSQHAPFNFDLSAFDIFVAAAAGAAISLVPEGLAVFPLQLSSFIQDQRITIWYSVPMVLTLLQARGKLEERDLSALRWVLFAGEVFPTKHLRTLMEKLPHPRYANLYGPTETNVCAYYEVEPLSPEETAPIPIGKACANTDLIPISADGKRVVTTNEEGLLYARGSTVMQGYYGRAEASAACFIPNPFAAGREEKLYCTGDWVDSRREGQLSLCRPQRSHDQDARLSGGAGRDRSRHGGTSGGGRGGGSAYSGRSDREHNPRRRDNCRQPVARRHKIKASLRREIASLHGAREDRIPGFAPEDRQRKDRSATPCRRNDASNEVMGWNRSRRPRSEPTISGLSGREDSAPSAPAPDRTEFRCR